MSPTPPPLRALYSSGMGLLRELHKRSQCHPTPTLNTTRLPAATTVPSLHAPIQSGPAKKGSCGLAQALAVSEKSVGPAQLHSQGVAGSINCAGQPHATSRSALQFQKGCNGVVRG